MLRQLGALLGKVGELQIPLEGSTIAESISKNISDLVMVLCNKDNAPQFLKFGATTGSDDREVDMEAVSSEASPRKAEEESGALAHLVISTVSTLPLQTPTYAGLTLAVNELSPKPEFSGFANRCVIYGMRHFSRDLDSLLLDGISEEDRSRTMSRLVHLLRYFTLLGRLSIVLKYENDDLMGTPKTEGLSVAGLLHMLTAASVKSATSMNQLPTACLLAQLVLSTLPYVQDTIPKDFVAEQLLEPLDMNVLNSETYKSTFAPGIGSTSLLLKEEQDEGLDDEDEEVDDENEDEEDESGQRCDTLQDLLRSVKRLVQSDGKFSTEFTLLTDAPWVGLKAPSIEQSPEGEEALPKSPLTYTGEPIRLSFSSDCKSVPSILSEGGDESIQAQCFELSGIVFGRLPIFGSPPEDNDEDEEDDEEMDARKNEHLQAYQKGFGLLDRYFLADAVRDCLLNHQSSVSDAGLERGTAKDVAQHLWSITLLYQQKGVEYGIIEAMLSLIMQANNEGAYRNLFVSRVLLELTRLQPSVMPQALALAVSNIVSYYLPALVPAARDNFSRWFSFHLNNTDYQWPSGYWEHWSEYVTNGKRNSRGDFVLRTLSLMASQLNEVETLVTDCLPPGSVLPKFLMAHEPDEKEPIKPDDASMAIERDVEVRIWEKNEDPDSLREYMVGDELSETIKAAHFGSDNTDLAKRWCRTGLAIRALLQPATKQHASEREAIERAVQPSEDIAMEQSDSNPDDVLVMLTENLVRYRPLLLGTLARDAESNDDTADLQGEAKTPESEQLAIGESFLLKQLENGLQYSHVLLENCVSCVVENEIASSKAVLYWALGSDGNNKNAPSLVKRWWDLARIAIRIDVEKALDSVDTQDKEPPGGMVIDRGDADDANQNRKSTSARKMDAIVLRINPVVQYMTKRVCTLLHEFDDGKNKLSPGMVDLVEGLKICVVATKALIIRRLTAGGDSVTTKEAHELWSKSSITGSDIASICSDQDTSCFAIQTLIASLQAM
jgi:hypothetical protein